MWRVARLALMWVLAVALPLQGAVAATMTACGLGFHRVIASDEASSRDGRRAEAPCQLHGHPSHGAGHAHPVAGSSSHDTTPAAQAHAHKCSTCASCCVNAAVSTASLAVDAVTSTDLFAPFVAPTPPAFVGDGLERPPRPPLA